jgi:hypothetical protein
LGAHLSDFSPFPILKFPIQSKSLRGLRRGSFRHLLAMLHQHHFTTVPGRKPNVMLDGADTHSGMKRRRICHKGEQKESHIKAVVKCSIFNTIKVLES